MEHKDPSQPLRQLLSGLPAWVSGYSANGYNGQATLNVAF
ncbi:autotransporter adhesin family protein [Buttiauxella noackiae]|nr:autotransporter adhesin family protein [Buttiauxella noackiae]